MFGNVPDEQWVYVSFADNLKINATFQNNFGSVTPMKEFKKLVDSSCLPPQFQAPIYARTSSGDVLKKMWNNKDFSDFSILVAEKEIRVHKSVLAVQSSVFSSNFKNNEEVKLTNKLEISGFTGLQVEKFLKCLYTGVIEDEEDALELFKLCWTYEVAEMKDSAEQLAIKHLNEENCLQALKIGNLVKSEAMIEAAFIKVQNIYPNIFSSQASKRKPEKIEEIVKVVKQLKRSLEENQPEKS